MKTILLSLLLLTSCQINSQISEWKNYGNDPGGQRYVRAKQINADNIKHLKVAWQFQTKELERYKEDNYLLERAAFEATPLVVNGKMFFPTPSNNVFALEAQTGRQLWHYDPKVDLFHNDISELTCRGVSYWSNGNHERLLMGTTDGRLISIDAKTGLPDPKFANNGEIDLKLGVGLVQVTSAPAICNDLVVVGTSIGDNNRTHAARGVVRAYRIADGKQLWSFDPIPTKVNDPAFAKWENGSAKRTGAANVWATISADPENDLVFLPSSSPSPDFYGGERLGSNDYANSVIALKASTGEYQWHFQVVHHDIWDYDIAAQPVLFDLPQGDKKIPAVAIGTKMGHIFILNRFTGEALMPFEEKAVPQSDIPGEQTSPTQPIPIKPAPLVKDLSLEAIWGINKEETQNAKVDFKSRRYEGIFTPPSFQGTIVSPGNTGGIHWGGMSYDPDRNLLVTNINRFATMVSLHKRHEGEKWGKYLNRVRNDENQVNPETNRMMGTPYRMSRMSYLNVQEKKGVWGLTQPPWGTILAIGLSTGDKVWEKPLGHLSEDPAFKEYGSINLGGTCLTSSGLTFVAGTMDNHLRAFDTSTGELLWEYPLPASGIATPMSYFLNGKQYIVIAAGGHGKNSLTKKGDFVIAFSL